MNDDVKDPLQGHGYSSTKSWSTGFWRRFPWTGMFSLIAAILASAFMVQIIAISDGRPINDWYYQPTVYLSMTYTIANLALQFALTQALTMAWWIKALKGDTSARPTQHMGSRQQLRQHPRIAPVFQCRRTGRTRCNTSANERSIASKIIIRDPTDAGTSKELNYTYCSRISTGLYRRHRRAHGELRANCDYKTF
jgi:hypothetical protein